MLGTLYVVMTSDKEEDYHMIKEKLLKMNPKFSISPYKESYMEKNAIEFFVTFETEENEVKNILAQLNNDWDGEYDDCIAYGFNTKMFDPLIYHLAFQLYD